MSCLVQNIFAIKSRSREKPNKCKRFWLRIFLEGTTPTFLGHIVSPPFGKVWLMSHLLTSVCEAWQGSRMHNLQRVCKHAGEILSRLWTKVHELFGYVGDLL